MLMSRTTRLALLTILGAVLAVPAVASAEDFCVGAPAGCTGTPVPAPLLKYALTVAETNGTDDRFLFAPGVFASDKFSYQSGERLQLIGAGAGKTIMRGNVDGSVLELGGNHDTSVSGLTLEPIGAATGGLTMQGTSARGVAVAAKGASSLTAGVQLVGDATFADGSVDLGGLDRYAVLVLSGAAIVTDSTLNAPAGVGFLTAGTETTLSRTTLDAQYGAIAATGHLTVSDTLVDLRGHAAPAIGVYATPNSGGNGPTTATVDAERLTIVGSTPGTSNTVGLYAAADGAGKSAGIHARDSVMSGIGVPVGRLAENGATANLTTDRSAYPFPIVSLDSGPGTTVEHDRLKVSPGFVDGAGGDFHLAAGSPLIDAGTAGTLPAGATDRDGRPRASDGDGDCTHVSDIGAFEYQGTHVRAVASAAAATAGVGQPVAFSATGSCIGGPGTPTIGWNFDDGAAAEGAAVTHAFAIPGRHTATVTVSDREGHQALATAALDVTDPAAPPAGGPRISRLMVTPSRVQIGRLLPKLVRGTVPRPLATIRFRLSKAATVRLRFAKRGRHGATSTVRTRVRIKARRGFNRIRFAARLTRKVRLTPGAYRLIMVATDASGARSKRAMTRFTAIHPTRR